MRRLRSKPAASERTDIADGCAETRPCARGVPVWVEPACASLHRYGRLTMVKMPSNDHWIQGVLDIVKPGDVVLTTRVRPDISTAERQALELADSAGLPICASAVPHHFRETSRLAGFGRREIGADRHERQRSWHGAFDTHDCRGEQEYVVEDDEGIVVLREPLAGQVVAAAKRVQPTDNAVFGVMCCETSPCAQTDFSAYQRCRNREPEQNFSCHIQRRVSISTLH